MLFAGAGALEELLVSAVAEVPDGLAPIEAAAAGIEARVSEPAASLTAEAAIAVFRIALERWIDEADQRDLSQVIRESLHELKAVTAGQ